MHVCACVAIEIPIKMIIQFICGCNMERLVYLMKLYIHTVVVVVSNLAAKVYTCMHAWS